MLAINILPFGGDFDVSENYLPFWLVDRRHVVTGSTRNIMKQKIQSAQPQAAINGSKTNRKVGVNPSGKQTVAGGGNITPDQQALSGEASLQCVLSALPSSLQKSDYCTKSLEIAAAAVKPPVVAGEPVASAIDPTQATYWASLINQHCNRSIELLLEAGKNLVTAKAKLEHGEWEKLFKKIPFNLREAQRLMQVAQHPVLSKTNNCSFLPPSPQALSALSKADPQALEKALIAKKINPHTTIAEAKSFRREHPVGGKKAQRGNLPKPFEVDRAVHRCRKVFFEEYHCCPEGDRDTFCELVEDVVSVMKKKDDTKQSPSTPTPTMDPNSSAVSRQQGLNELSCA